MARSYKEIMNDINTFIFDVDGVLTDSNVTITSTGELWRVMNTRDGYAIKTAVDKGYTICVISGGNNEGVRSRLRGLGVTDIYLGAHNKMEVYKEFIELYNINPTQILYMGDDIPDYYVMKEVALATSPQDAVAEIKSISHYVSHKNGGAGCVRDVIEQVLKVQGKWMENFDGKHD
jgi:3-deoxy-D-manno-octulosonate 8-phosphate phosphatase (KDO 8-P phosphatase)